MKKYLLSPLYAFIDLKEHLYGAKVGLTHQLDDEILTLNTDIAYFLQQFLEPRLLSEVIKLFAEKYQAKISDIKPIVRQFFYSMENKGILVSEQEAQRLTTLIHAPPSREGDTLKSYILEKRLSFIKPVDIYLACDNAGKKVLIKILNMPLNTPTLKKQVWKKSFENEFKILEKLCGANAKNHNLGFTQHVEFDKKEGIGITTFFENSMSINKRVNEKEKLRLEEKIDIFNQLKQTIAFFHKQSIVHGDLHTSNILINDKKDTCVIDFDLAINQNDIDLSDRDFGGAAEFIPPERIGADAFESIKSIPTVESDIFQLGVVGYFIFYEKLPFEGHTWKQLAQAILNDEPSFDSDIVPSDIQQFLRNALSKSPNDRVLLLL
jgi:eukaryotic-like serine/threonine-protein kinase